MRSDDTVVGGFYSVVDSGGFRVAKVLVVADGEVDVRLFKNEFVERPATVDPSSLELGRFDDPEGFGIGHIPLHESSFLAMEPHYIEVSQPVTEEELEGYELWLEGEGGLW